MLKLKFDCIKLQPLSFHKGVGSSSSAAAGGALKDQDSERVLYTFTKDGEIQAMDNVQSSHRCLDPLHGLYESPSHRDLVYSFGSVWAFSDPFLGLLQCRTMTKTVTVAIIYVNGGFSSDPADLIILNPYSIWVENHVHPTQWRTTSRFGDPNLGRS